SRAHAHCGSGRAASPGSAPDALRHAGHGVAACTELAAWAGTPAEHVVLDETARERAHRRPDIDETEAVARSLPARLHVDRLRPPVRTRIRVPELQLRTPTPAVSDVVGGPCAGHVQTRADIVYADPDVDRVRAPVSDVRFQVDQAV